MQKPESAIGQIGLFHKAGWFDKLGKESIGQWSRDLNLNDLQLTTGLILTDSSEAR